MRNLDLSMLEAKVHALSLRERVILLVCLLTVIVGLYDRLYFSGALSEYRRLSAQSEELGRIVTKIGDQMAPLSNELATDNDKGLRADIEKLTATSDQLDRDIGAASSQLVTSRSMNQVLQVLVEERPGLVLHTLRTLPVGAVNLGTEASPMLLYEHGVQLSISGSFSALLQYLRDIEERETRAVWDKLSFSRTDGDTGRIDVVIKTLGRDQEFIQVNR